MEKLIEVKNISKNYGETAALADVSFSLPEKGFVFVTGISGSGKTTLLNLMAGLARPNFGKILYAGRDVYSADSDHLSRPFRPTFTEGETSSRGELITPPESEFSLPHPALYSSDRGVLSSIPFLQSELHRHCV